MTPQVPFCLGPLKIFIEIVLDKKQQILLVYYSLPSMSFGF